MTRHSERARRALAHLGEADPALAALALWCEHRDGEGDTRTEGDAIFYGPDFPLRPLQEQVGLAGHHILHVTLRHPARMSAMAARMGADFDAALYNVASDAVVNEAMLRAGHAIPRPAVRLADLVDDADDALARWDADRLFVHLRRRQAKARPEQGDGGTRDLFVGEARQEGDARAAEWQGHLVRALQTGRQAGRGIGRTGAALGGLPLSRIPWEVRLRGLVARAVSEVPRRSHRRPASRWVAMEAKARARKGPAPVFEPGFSRDRLRPRIAVGLDSSSSIDDATFDRFAAEIRGIARRTGAETHVLAFDEGVYARRRLVPGRDDGLLDGAGLRRGGGTSFVEVVAEAEALGASVAVILTDLDGPTGRTPAIPVVWAVPDHTHSAPDFGRVVTLDQ